ncbi:MAG TPA: cytochrome c1 [Hyphomicrobiaceae bacterium]|jgi:ubiquinol-cytochrome c reductase cytochrome c1 subunit|nr:cytochrome c1 [Hyphomicrobiaceae bacterium]
MVKMGGAGLALAALGVAAAAWAGPVLAQEHGGTQVARQPWTFSGLFGEFNNNQLQRGFRVYTEICSRCHSLNRIYFRNLADPDGPAFPVDGVKSLAATHQVEDGPDDNGKMFKRPGTLTDAIPSPYKNDKEARAAHNGALPPDLSLIVRARSVENDAPFYLVPYTMVRDVLSGYQESGADYLYAYLTGFQEPPKGFKLGDFMQYNRVFPGHQTAMPPPFAGGDGVVKYDDGTPATVDNYARDVTAFLAWAADPRLEDRKRLGLLVMIYLIITAVLLGFAKRRIWREVH